jgi:hypothetical protein
MMRPSTSSRSKRPKVAEHSRRDAHARGGERSAEEDGRVRRLAEREADDGSSGKRHHHTNRGDRHRRSAHLAQLTKIHLHSHREQQQQHTDLGEHRHRHTAIAAEFDEPEARWADDDAGDDFSEHSRHPTSLGDLCSDLGGRKDDEEVE